MSPKASHTFKTFGERFETICQAMQAQKTLCKHLLRQPFSEEVVEDPGAAVSRIRNNRKVNLGKKEAIDKGREALGEKGRGKGRRTTKVVQEDTDDDFEGDDDEYGSQAGAQMYNSKKRSVSYSNAPNSRRRQASTDDPRDQSYREGSASKKVKRASRSVYQLNDQNQMVDTSQQQLKAERGPMQQSSHEHLHVGSPYGFHSITGVADAHPDDPLFGSSDVIDRPSFVLPGSLPASDPNGFLTSMHFSSILYMLRYLLARITLSSLASEWASSPRRFATARSFACLRCPILNPAVDISLHSTRLRSLPEPNLHPTDQIHFFFILYAPSLERERQRVRTHMLRVVSSAALAPPSLCRESSLLEETKNR